MLDDRVRQNCIDCGVPILVEKRYGNLTNVCRNCTRKYMERHGVRKPVLKKKPRVNGGKG